MEGSRLELAVERRRSQNGEYAIRNRVRAYVNIHLLREQLTDAPNL